MTLNSVLRGRDSFACLSCKNTVSHAEYATQNHAKTCHARQRITVLARFPSLHHKLFPDPDDIFAVHTGFFRADLRSGLPVGLRGGFGRGIASRLDAGKIECEKRLPLDLL